MPILIDGNNLLHGLPRGSRTRSDVRRLALDRVRHEHQRVTVVFDGPPPTGSPEREALGKVSIVWAGSRSADDVIVASLPSGPEARQWVVVTDDRGLARRAQDRGAEVRPLAAWRARSSGRGRGVRAERETHRVGDVASWEAYFDSRGEDDDAPRRVPRRRRPASDSDDL